MGLGYVGLPLALELNKLYDVIGFDVDTTKIAELSQGFDRTQECDPMLLKQCTMSFSSDENVLSEASIIIVTVPTPIDRANKPDLKYVESATEMIGRHLKKGTIVVYESTVYPGVTDNVCAPILEKVSGLVLNKDFFLGYSPERLSPGDKNKSITKIMKIVSGSTPESASLLKELYGSVIPAGIHVAPTIKVAEAAKIIENTQRDLNIALMNELSIVFNKMDISTIDVIEAAATKWNFMAVTPGLVGGHCIGVDPYYLTYRAQQLGYIPDVIIAGRRINDGMGKHVAQEAIKLLIKNNKPVKNASVAILGFTFKENVSDIRNTKVIDIIRELKEYNVSVSVLDPHASPKEMEEEYHVSLSTMDDIKTIDLAILAVSHANFPELNSRSYLNKFAPGSKKIIMDLKSIQRDLKEDASVAYWAL